MEKYICNRCNNMFTTKWNLKRHQATSCNVSEEPPSKRTRVKTTTRVKQPATKGAPIANLAQPGPSGMQSTGRIGMATTDQAGPSGMQPNTDYTSAKYCDSCSRYIPAKTFSAHLRSLKHKAYTWKPLNEAVRVSQSAFGGKIVSYQVVSGLQTLNIEDYLESIKSKIIELLEQEVMKHNAVKANIELFAVYILPAKETRDVKSHNTANKVFTVASDFSKEYDALVTVISDKSKGFAERESGWVLEKILYLEVNISKYNPLRASSYIPLPKEIANKKAVVNMNNQDECCFAWSIVAALFSPQGRVTDTKSYPHYSTIPFLNFSTIDFPVSLKAIPQWEQVNTISLNVYGLEPFLVDGKWKYHIVGPLHYTSKKQTVHINLLLVDDSNGKQHYCWIKNFSRLLSSQLTANTRTKYFCDGCLQYFPSESLRDCHLQQNCKFVAVKLPRGELRQDRLGNLVPDNVLKFENYHKQLKVPFCVYADFECILSPIPPDSTDSSNRESYTIKKYKHSPSSFAYYIKFTHNEAASKLQIYRGENAAAEFIKRLQADIYELYNTYLKDIAPMHMTQHDVSQFDAATECYICDKPFEPFNRKVRDHCHITGRYRGAAHSICNLNFKLPNYVPIVFHNLRNYDAHIFINQLGADKGDITVLPQTFEKYISFTKLLPVNQYKAQNGTTKSVLLQMRFIDSYQFLSTKLETLASLLDPSQCREVRRAFPDDTQFEYMRQKGVFPYSYLTDMVKFSETSLPDKECFYDELRDAHISQEDYNRACKAWTALGCKTLGDYSDMYLTSDVLLLADVFENYRDLCLKTYHLDPAHYFTAPGLSWDAMLRHTKIELQLLSDIEMIHFFKKGIRGGVSTCITRKAEANNPHLPTFDATKPTSYIMYLDATNLYGYSMSQHLPLGQFEWMTSDEVKNFSEILPEVSDTSNVGYVLEVDLEVPRELHDFFNEYPFCPEMITPPGGKGKKLIPNLYEKTRYIIHYRALQQCLKYGIVLKKIHKGLRFAQAKWLEPYIALNTQLRNQAKNKFENGMYKTMVNCIFGKTIENVEKRVDIKLATTFESNSRKRGASNYISKPTFKELRIFSENLVAIQMEKTFIDYCRPTYVGFCILDIAKIVIYDFVYDFLKPTYGDNCTILYTDTDSLIVHVKTSNFYADMKANISRFDTSNYTVPNCHNVPKNQSILGKMKDEYAGKVLAAFYGTGAKAYCIDSIDEVCKKAKGITKASVDNQLDIIHYKTIVEGSKNQVYCMMYVFKSESHTIYTNYIKKVALTNRDDKRYLIPDSTSTLAWGHKDIAFHETPQEERLELLLHLLNEAMAQDNDEPR
ncbi:unnamed protein product [Callosobruchus maculatus]|uniref:C2H2-type domain-containing protein n=1 Tax=Callosobruchus maculatus TaxID=64391 RepID=A0A653D590_CALMS|nr:unnamed protein product [Callosobruchus maculatus]